MSAACGAGQASKDNVGGTAQGIRGDGHRRRCVGQAAHEQVNLICGGLAAGLPGVLRAELIEEERAVVTSLTPGDLEVADRLFIGNSLRGLRQACLAR